MARLREQVSYFAARASEQDIAAHTTSRYVEELQQTLKHGKVWKEVVRVKKTCTREEAKLAYGLAMASVINNSKEFGE